MKSEAGAVPQKPGDYREKERLIRLGTLSGLVTFSLKLAAAVLSNSLIIFTDLLRSVSEFLAFFFAWLTMRRIAGGKVAGYEFGYGKLESASSLLMAGVLVSFLVIALVGAVERFQHPVETHRVELGFFVALAATGWNAVMWRRGVHRVRRDPSPIIVSHAHVFRNKTLANGTVVAGLTLSEALEGFPGALYIDPATALVLCGFLALSIYSIVSQNAADLLDRTLDESLQLRILRTLSAHFDEYVAFHGMRSRRSARTVYIELFLEFEGTRTMADVQAAIDRITADLERDIPDSEVVIAPTTARRAG